MRTVNVEQIDLNLLHVFAAVHDTRSVGRAAERLGLSQPAMSAARLNQRPLAPSQGATRWAMPARTSS